MGSYYHTLVVVDRISDEEARNIVDLAQKWLMSRDIIDSDLNDSPLLGLGYKPGCRYQEVVVNEDDMFRLLPEMRTNGMRALLGRQIFWGWISLGVFELHCEHCGKIEINDIDWSKSGLNLAINNWENESSDIGFACPNCKQTKPVDSWDFGDTLAFGNLGFEFWNWPRFKASFLSEFEEIIGCKVRVVSGKI